LKKTFEQLEREIEIQDIAYYRSLAEAQFQKENPGKFLFDKFLS